MVATIAPPVENLDQYLERYANLLGQQTNHTLDPLHVPGRDLPFPIRLKRPMFEAQAHCASAAAKALDRQDSVLIVAECGSGKSVMGMCSAHAHARGKPYTGLIFCPGQLVKKWERELREVLPGIQVNVIRSFHDIVRLKDIGKPSKPTWWIISRDRAKMGAKWRAAYNKRRDGMPVCPHCWSPIIDERTGTPVSYDKLNKKRHWCEAEVSNVDGSIPKDRFGKVKQCGHPLWTYTHKLDRWEPARYIQKHLHNFFDYLIVDEVHQEKGADTAQGNAFGSLAASCRKTIALTGTLIGGYADHLRPTLFRLMPKTLVDEGLSWNDYMAFNERYGRIETRITEKETDSGDDNNQSRGSKTNRTKYVRPGIMPTLFGRHLLDKCVFLTLDEVAENLPPLDEIVVPVRMDCEQKGAYDEIEKDLSAAIRDMVKRGDKRLLGKMLGTLLGYPDHPYDYGQIGYMDGEEFRLVTTAPDLDRETIRPKEEALLKLVAKEKAEGRQAWVYVQMTDKRDVLSRLEKLLTDAGHRVKVMRSNVPLVEREEWIEKHGRDVDVVLSHPQLVETGLDLFSKAGTHNFCSLIFYETGYNLFTMRQASRRSWRIGQRKDCRIYYMYYAGTMQERAMVLMGKKLTAAQAIEGKFSSEGLAALAGEDASVEMALAKSLSSKISDEDAQRVWVKVAMEHRPTKPLAPLDVWSEAGTDGADELGEFEVDVDAENEPETGDTSDWSDEVVNSPPDEDVALFVGTGVEIPVVRSSSLSLWDGDDVQVQTPRRREPPRAVIRRTVLSLFD